MKRNLEVKYSRCHSCQHSHSSGSWHPNYDYKQQRLCDLLGSCGLLSSDLLTSDRLRPHDLQPGAGSLKLSSLRASPSQPQVSEHTLKTNKCRQWARLQLRWTYYYSVMLKKFWANFIIYTPFAFTCSNLNVMFTVHWATDNLRVNFLKKPSSWSFIDLIQQVSFRLLSKWPS